MLLRARVFADCLFLNIYAPIKAVRGGWPVIVWIHGGSFLQGAGNEQRTNGTYAVELRQDVIIVTINYRLGAWHLVGSAPIS